MSHSYLHTYLFPRRGTHLPIILRSSLGRRLFLLLYFTHYNFHTILFSYYELGVSDLGYPITHCLLIDWLKWNQNSSPPKQNISLIQLQSFSGASISRRHVVRYLEINTNTSWDGWNTSSRYQYANVPYPVPVSCHHNKIDWSKVHTEWSEPISTYKVDQ